MARYVQLTVALCLVLVIESSAVACPFCNSSTAEQVRVGIFNSDFGYHLGVSLAPFSILIAALLLFYYWPANIGPRAELSIWAGWMLDPEKPIYLVLRQDTDLPEVQRQFTRVGYYKFGGYLLGGMEEWNNEARPINSMYQMDVLELNAALPPKDLQILDVRTPDERQNGYIPGSTYIFLPELEEKAERLNKSQPVAVYCDSGYRASLAASLLLRIGFKDVRNVPGSWKAWKTIEDICSSLPSPATRLLEHGS